MITSEEKKYLLAQMKEVLEDNEYNYSIYALEKIIDTWANNKADLIEKFKSHPNYLEGKFMIAFDADFDREIDKDQSWKFSQWLLRVYDEVKDNFPEAVVEGIEKSFEEYKKNSWFILVDNPYKFPGFLNDFISYLRNYANRTLDEGIAESLDKVVPDAHIHANEKTSRAVNKICTYLGYDKHPDYNKEFAKYADSLSPLKIKRHTVLSINPIDYLLMSNGNSWSSCHGIDDNGGCYSSGTISYMLDESSMVFYTVDASYNGNEYFLEQKINRQMYHWGEEKLVQGRLYPQSCDCGSKDSYDAYRAIVQKIMSELYEFPNRWKVSRGIGNVTQYTSSYGTHYRDYCHFDNCTLSRVRDSKNEYNIRIGHNPICIDCGSEHRCTENINHCENGTYICECCGHRINEYDVRWVGDYPYCEDCVTYCDECGEYEINDRVRYVESTDRYVCDACLEYNYVCCDECGEYVPCCDTYYVESEDRYVCDYCRENEFERCHGCGQLVRNADIEMYDSDWYCPDCIERIRENEEEAM